MVPQLIRGALLSNIFAMFLRWTWFLPVVISSLSSVALSTPEVRLGDTTIIGRTVKGAQDVEFFGGIPYADAPLGNLRFSPPVPKKSLKGVTFNATQYGASCLQFLTFTPPLDVGHQAEDCLFVNVVRPAGVQPGSNLPVLFWIHGGGFTAGASTQFDPSELVRRSVARETPIVFVSVNYRLGPLGFPAGSEAAAHSALNSGVKDTYAALQWVQENIHNFGGDKSKVTEFGESAGAMTIGVHFLNPDLNKFVRAGIMQSGAAPLSPPSVEPSQDDASWAQFTSLFPECAHAVVNETFGCLRRVDAAAMVQAVSVSASQPNDAQYHFSWTPTVDGPGGVYPGKPTDLYKKGHFAHLPWIQGNNLDEGTLFVDPSVNSTEALQDYILSTLNLKNRMSSEQQKIVQGVLRVYPDDPALGSPYDTGNETFGMGPEWKRAAAIGGDSTFQSLRRALVDALVGSNVNGYGYLFTDHYPPLPASWGVPHGVDQPYLFPDLQLYGFVWNKTAIQKRLQENMMDYWLSFTYSLDPNDAHGNADRPHWPSYNSGRATLQLDSSNMTIIADDYRKEAIDFLISVA